MVMLRRISFATSLLAVAGCVVSSPPPQQSYTSYPPPRQTSSPPPAASYQPPPPPSPSPSEPVYTQPDGDGDYVNIDEVPPNESAPSADVFTDSLAPYGQWSNDPRYGRVWTPSDPNYRPYHSGYW